MTPAWLLLLLLLLSNKAAYVKVNRKSGHHVDDLWPLGNALNNHRISVRLEPWSTGSPRPHTDHSPPPILVDDQIVRRKIHGKIDRWIDRYMLIDR